MGKYKVLSPVGGLGSRVFDHGEIVEEKDLRTPASELVKEGFLEVYNEDEASVEVSKSGEQEETKLPVSKEDDNFYNPNTKTEEEFEEEKLQAGEVKLEEKIQGTVPEEKKDEASEETLRDEIKAELDAKGIKYNSKASKKQLYDLLEKSGK